MKISLVMPTYNGANYILPQLESILAQERQPDEVILCDDVSSDGTYEICRDFVERNHLTHWTVLQNKKNLGYSENFYFLVSQTTGDVFFFADQDDIWLPNKIKVMATVLEEHPEIELLSCKQQEFVGAVPAVCAKKTGRRAEALTAVRLSDLLRNFHDSSIQLALRKSFFDGIADYVSGSGLPNDWAVCLFAAARGALWRLDETLVLRRVHSGNTSSIGMHQKNRSNRNYRIQQIEKNRKMYLQTAALLGKQSPSWLDALLVQMETVDYQRMESLRTHNLARAISNLITKRSLVRTKSLLGDVVCILRRERKEERI